MSLKIRDLMIWWLLWWSSKPRNLTERIQPWEIFDNVYNFYGKWCGDKNFPDHFQWIKNVVIGVITACKLYFLLVPHLLSWQIWKRLLSTMENIRVLLQLIKADEIEGASLCCCFSCRHLMWWVFHALVKGNFCFMDGEVSLWQKLWAQIFRLLNLFFFCLFDLYQLVSNTWTFVFP